MALIDFSSNNGQTIAYSPVADTLVFGVNYDASQLSFEQDGADLIVRVGFHWVRLASLSFGSLMSSDFWFYSGGAVRLDTAGNNVLNGNANDYFDIRKGGSDTVNAGSGDDRIYAGAGLNSGDAVSGGAGFDILTLSGNYASTVVFGATTVTGVEQFVVEAGSAVRLAFDAATLAAASSFYVDATAQLAGDLLYLDGSAATQAFSVDAGAGDDTIIGGSGDDYLNGSEGDDYLVGGSGYNELYGLWGNDTLIGGDDEDLIHGGDGTDIIASGAGDDVIQGNSGDDQISAGDGDDVLGGDEGNDILDGGAGADAFVLADYGFQGDDQINGFDPAEDTFWLVGLRSFTGLSEAGGNTTLTHSHGTAQINGVTGLTLAQWNELLDYRFEYAPPVITSDGGGATAELEMLEGETAVTTVTAVDPNDAWSSYAISGGADAALFEIDTLTGELAFLAAPDFEAPADADSDNVYEVIVTASDGLLFDSQAISITIEDVEEGGGSQEFSRFPGFDSSPGGWKFEDLGPFALRQYGDFSLSMTDWLV